MPRKHLSQFAYDGKDADTVPLRITDDDLATIRALNPEIYTYLPAPWLHAVALPHKNYIRFAGRVARLARWRHQFNDGGTVLPDVPLEAPYLQRHQVALKHAVYSRTERGDHLANQPTPYRSTQWRAHQILQDLVHASIELGVRKHPAFQMVHWPALRDNGWTEHGQRKYIPDPTLTLRHPHLIKLRASHSHADGAPFLLKHAGSQLFILAKEIDRKTEPLTSANERRTIKEKFAHYQEIFDRKLYQTHYGFPNSIVLFVTISESRMNSMIAFALETIGRCAWLIFYHWKDWYNERSYPPPTDYIFTTPGKRGGFPHFRLCQFWDT